jgi:CRISPR/Cas system-associated endonuclease/helicase Cas3
MDAEGYWYKHGKLIELVSGHHIDYILDNPEKFYLTKEGIIKTHEKYGDKLGQEGKARDEIILNVVEDGWIRIRHYVRPKDYWSIQFDKFRFRESDLKSLIETLILKEKIMRKDDELHLIGFNDGYTGIYSFMQGGAMKFLLEEKLIKTKEVSIIERYIKNKI